MLYFLWLTQIVLTVTLIIRRILSNEIKRDNPERYKKGNSFFILGLAISVIGLSGIIGVVRYYLSIVDFNRNNYPTVKYEISLDTFSTVSYYYEFIGLVILLSFIGIIGTLLCTIKIATRETIDKENIIVHNKNQIKSELAKANFENTISYKYISHPLYKINLEFCIDTLNKQFAFIDVTNGLIKIINFNNIISCEILEDNNIIVEGGIGRAVAGGILAGGVGAIVGASTRSSKKVIESLKVRVVTNIVTDSKIIIEIIKSRMTTDNEVVKAAKEFAENIYTAIQSSIANSKNAVDNINQQNNEIEQKKITNFKLDKDDIGARLEKLDLLKEKSLISEEEFTNKRLEILSEL